MRRISATEVMIEHNSKLARDPAHLRRLVAFWPEENIVHQLAKNALAYMEREAVPAGWKLVPVEPTQEMVDACFDGTSTGGIQKGYRAMLAAAPEVGK